MSLTLRLIILLIIFSNNGTLGIALDERNWFGGEFLERSFHSKKSKLLQAPVDEYICICGRLIYYCCKHVVQ